MELRRHRGMGKYEGEGASGIRGVGILLVFFSVFGLEDARTSEIFIPSIFNLLTLISSLISLTVTPSPFRGALKGCLIF
jgi:hypothetical protein